MITKSLPLLAIASLWFVAPIAFAVTVPAGTTLNVKTLDSISSHERVGRTFTAELDQNVRVNGKVALPAGTKLTGKIVSSRGSRHTSNPLSLDLTSVSANGHNVPVKTADAFQPENKPNTARGSRRDVSVGSYAVPLGTKMQFRLAQPLNL